MHSIPCPLTGDSSSRGSPRPTDPGAVSGGARGVARPACCERRRFVQRASHIGFSVLCLALLLWFLGPHAHAQSVAQTFQLRAGWNSIWLELEPTNAATINVLAGAPFASVWTFADRISAVDFIENPAEPVWNRDRWLRAVPTNHPGAFQNNLFTMPGARAYLIQVTNAFTLTVTGRPVLRRRPWAPDAYTLCGLPVDPAAPATFGDFFAPSPAHFDAASAHLQKIYRLASTGQWTAVAATDRIAYGEAYWIFTRGGSHYAAPFEIHLDGGDGLDFGSSLRARTLTILNQRTAPVSVRVRDLSPPSRLSYARFNPTNGIEWIDLPSTLTQSLAPGASLPWRAAIRRQTFEGDRHETVLEFLDGLGPRLRVAVTAVTASEALTHGNGVQGAADAVAATGLWLGSASISAVSEVHSTDPFTPTRTAAEFNLRLLLHVDRRGTVRLLKEVTQLWKDGTATNDAAGRAVLAIPGRYVLVTDESLFPQFDGVTLRDGTPAGRRLSAIGYDFPKENGANYLILDGAFGDGGTLTGKITLTPEFPTNPFRHKYHPDHDNLDERFANFRAEAYQIERNISLTFSSAAPAGTSIPDYGHGVWAGTYRETVTGLNRRPITCKGPFRLTRLIDTPDLNQ
jgi:hypothetical protein